MTWSPQQDAALMAVDVWLKSPSEKPYYLGGFAGTGKTTLAKHLAEGVKGDVLFAAFTGKAALVMRAKGCVGAATIHSLIYRPKPKRDGSVTFELNEDSPVAGAALVVVDECSMVGPELGRDLMSFGTKVLVLGDPAQLPPVDGAGFFTGGEPDFMLTEVHRQAADNPIIAMSMRVREGGRLDIGSYGESRVIPRRALGRKVVMGADQILVGRNATRRGVNAKVRGLLERDPAGPQAGDRLVCLRNDKDKKLLNGGLWDVAAIVSNDGASVEMDVTPDDNPRGAPVRVGVLSEFFHGQEEALTPKQRRGYQEFTYGYALTVHKSQGSQWDRVVLFDEGSAFREHQARWLYTGVTRAAEQVVVVQS